MKLRILIIFLVLITSIVSNAQEENNTNLTTDTTSTRFTSNEKEDYSTTDRIVEQLLEKMLREVGDSLSFAALDSLITKIDSFRIARKQVLEAKTYGHQLFRNYQGSAFANQAIAKIPDSYILGVGDEITLSIFGAAQFDNKFTVDEGGFINPTKVPKIFLKGVPFGQAKQLIKRRFGQFYLFRPEQMSISISNPRTITINVFGEVNKPGSYTVPAVTTAFTAMALAGGPTELGSVRNIKVVNDTEQKVLDIYDIINNPAKQFEYYLEDNAIIQVPAAGKVVALAGAVKRPLQYELTDQEGLTNLLTYAGGFKGNAYKDLIQIKRFDDGIATLIDLSWNNNNQQRVNLVNGDSVMVKAIANNALERVVAIRGAIELPGDYALASTPNLSTLINKGKLKREALLDIAFLLRTDLDSNRTLVQVDLQEIINNPNSAENLKLQPKDVLLVNEQQQFANRSFISVRGAVRNELDSFQVNPDSSITMQQAILLAGGLAPEATDFGYLIRTDANNYRKKEYLRVDVKSAMRDVNSDQNFLLQPFDELVLLSNAIYTDTAYVSIKGAVHLPGKLFYDVSLQLQDALSLAGGLKDNAAKNRIEVFRVETDADQPTKTIIATLSVDEQLNPTGANTNFSLQPFDEIVVRELPDFELQNFVEIKGEVLFPGEYALVKQNESLASIIQRAGGLTPEAFINGVNILRVDTIDPIISYHRISPEEVDIITTYRTQRVVLPLQIGNGKNFNHLLQTGDVIIIPKQKDDIEIRLANTGASKPIDEDKPDTETVIADKISVVYVGDKSAKWYIQEYAGGFGADADKSKVTVEYPNGAIKGTKRIGIFYKYPKPTKGSIISVGAKPLEEEETKDKNKKSARPRKGATIFVEPYEEDNNRSEN